MRFTHDSNGLTMGRDTCMGSYSHILITAVCICCNASGGCESRGRVLPESDRASGISSKSDSSQENPERQEASSDGRQDRIRVLSNGNSESEQRALKAALHWLRNDQRSERLDVEIRVTPDGSSCLVAIVFVTGRGPNGEPHYAPGASCLLVVSGAGEILDVDRGL